MTPSVMRELCRITHPCNVTPPEQQRLVWTGGGTNHCNRTRQRKYSKASFNGVIHVTFVCVLLCLDHTTVLAQTCDPEKACYPLSVDLLQYTGNQNRTLEVSSTCGHNKEPTPYSRSATSLDSKIFYCNSTSDHPAEYMIDKTQITILDFTFQNPNFTTYWQSENTLRSPGGIADPQFVTFKMADVFLVRNIRAIFISPHDDLLGSTADMRPFATVVETRASLWAQWQPLRYFARNCSTTFPRILQQKVDGTGPQYDSLTAVCIETYFGGDVRTMSGWGYGRQQLVFNPAREFDKEFASSRDVQKHFMASALRLQFLKPSNNAPFSSYYAIADLVIEGHCACFGHAGRCIGENNEICVCEHNTRGQHCEECLPLFNNRPWRVGANQLANACEYCDCHDHAVSCHYDVTRGHGVCDKCTSPTTGDKCQFCEAFYRVNPQIDRGNDTLTEAAECTGYVSANATAYNCSDWCIPCNCSLEGSLPLSSYSCDNFTGQCECKRYVEGRACGQCSDGFWNLSLDKIDGCQACHCDQRGTVNNSNLCDKETGDCVCKVNTEGLDCGQCKTGAFNLSLDTPEGCTPCDCDPGGSLDAICPKDSGLCRCRTKIGGRKCNTPDNGYFVPRLDHLIYEAEFTSQASEFKLTRRAGHGELNSTISGLGLLDIPGGSTIQFVIEVPMTRTYKVVMRYESGSEWPAVVVTTKARGIATTDLTCGGKTYHPQDAQELTTALSSVTTKGATVVGEVCLSDTVSYSIDVAVGTATPSGGVLLLDSVILLPCLSSLQVHQEADDATRSSIQTCYDLTQGINLAARANLSCQDYGYSLMAELYSGAIACQCDAAGSNGSVCDGHSGQCPCKPGMMLLDCSLCKVDHYGFDPSSGCKACDCHPHGARSVSCSESGVCDCHPNVIGVKCDSCLDQYYGLYTGVGCRPCHCSGQYAVNNSCMDTGQCHCKPGVDGLNCDHCLDGFYALTSVGCTSCGCHPEGSTVSACDKTTGRCSCKTQTYGRRCDQCVAGYFGLGNWTSDGCIQCICSGHSSNCTSSPHWYRSVYRSSWDLLTGPTAMQDHWTAVSGTGQFVPVKALTKITPVEAEIVLRITNDDAILMEKDVFFVATQPFLGNKRSSYGQSLSFVIRLTDPTSGVNVTSENGTVIDRETGDVVLLGTYTSFTLVANISVIADGEKHSYTMRLIETDWHVNATRGRNPTYQEFLELFTAIRSIRVRAKYTNTTGGMVDLCGAQIVFASTDNSSGIPVNNVEQCTCPPQYTGPSCDICSHGYTRAVPNGGPFVECVPCDCNGHAATPCDADTGVCNCTHDATGDHCSVCLAGFYGNPVMGTPGDCEPCMCPGNVVAVEANVFASECVLTSGGAVECLNCSEGHSGRQCDICMEGWYGTPHNTSNAGGQCLPCQCHGRADTCDTVTGICVDCRNDTAGKECNICAPTFFGDVASYSCRLCDCKSAGSTGQCDHRTGQCQCKPNVQSFLCTECAPNTFNYSSGEGCYPCDCHMAGAYGPSCNLVTGQCVCRSLTLGRRCDYCEDTYWQVNSTTGCKSCYCTPEGTANNTGAAFGTCDVETGQCQCALPGIVGRTCDRCAAGSEEAYQFVQGVQLGVYPDCQLCGACYDTWAVRIEEEGLLLQGLAQSVLQLWARYDNMTYAAVHPLLADVRTNLTNVESAVLSAQDIVNDVRFLQRGFDKVSIRVGEYKTTHLNMTRHVEKLQEILASLTSYLGNVAISETEKKTPEQFIRDTVAMVTLHDDLYSQANSSWTRIRNLTMAIKTANGTVEGLVSQMKSSVVVLREAKRITKSALLSINTTIGPQFNNNTQRLKRVQTVVGEFTRTLAEVSEQLASASDLSQRANVSVSVSFNMSQSKVNAAGEMVTRALVAKYSASEAQRAALTAQSAAKSYLEIATDTKQAMTATLENTVGGLVTMDSVNEQLIVVNELTRNVSRIALPQVGEMVEICKAINATSISDVAVSATLTKAKEGLAKAQEALNMTQLASETAHVALEEVREVQYNLGEAVEVQGQVYAQREEMDRLNQTYTTAIQQVEKKATDAIRVAETTNASVSSISALVKETRDCFQDLTSSKTQADVLTEKALQLVNDAANMRLKNVESLQNLSKELGRRIALDSATYATLTEVHREMRLLQQDLIDIEQITDIQSILRSLRSQTSEMTTMQQELDRLESDLDDLVTNLANLDPQTVRCTHN